MSSAGFTKRRGLRLIVARGPIISTRVGKVTTQRIELTLECGHVVVRGTSGWQNTRSALCPTCRKADGEARDRAKAAAE